jgi:LytS/YehU family sensor histidine kinase
LEKDVEGSNRFITGFSRLIRQTLDISARKEISLEEEIIYLSTYLELEKTRFENKFSFEINVSEDLNKEEVYLPPMMLQPFVENSIRHGIRYRPDSNGRIVVGFDKVDGELVCLVEDNGIGRKAALGHKSTNPIEYQSKGMSLIAARVEFLNQNFSGPISLKIEDIENEKQQLMGTRVTMKFPLQNG